MKHCHNAKSLSKLLFQGNNWRATGAKHPEFSTRMFHKYTYTLCNYKYGEGEKIRAKNKVFFVHAMKAYRGRTGIDPPILNLGTRWRWVVNVTTHPRHIRYKTLYPLNWRVSGAQRRSGRFGEKSLASTGIPTPGHPARCLVAVLTTIFRFQQWETLRLNGRDLRLANFVQVKVKVR
jgi:hypothetical protein